MQMPTTMELEQTAEIASTLLDRVDELPHDVRPKAVTIVAQNKITGEMIVMGVLICKLGVC